MVGSYLVYQAVERYFFPQEVEGGLVILVSIIALSIDVLTALLTFGMSKNNINIRIAFIHNLADALSSVAVILAGGLILKYQWYFVDPFLTLVIASYILYQGCASLPNVIHILMEGSPTHLAVDDVVEEVCALKEVVGMHHVHIWQMDEHTDALEAHVVIGDLALMGGVKSKIKELLRGRFQISHSTLEFEAEGEVCPYPEHG